MVKKQIYADFRRNNSVAITRPSQRSVEMANIRTLSSGKWQVQFRHRGLRPVAKSFKSKAEAGRWARLMGSEFDRGVFVDRTECERITIGELIDRYLVEITPAKKSASREVLRLSELRRHFGAYSPATIRSTNIAAYRDQRLQSGLAGATVVKELNSLSHRLDVAIKDWGIGLSTNPVKMVRRPKVA
jgi:hypothetical protein